MELYAGEDLRLDDLEQGLNIYTSLDPIIQRKLESTANKELRSIKNQRGLPEGILETGALVTQLGSSKIVALIGGQQAGFDGFNRATQAKRAIGSLIKPAIYLTALQKPGSSWATVVSDEALSWLRSLRYAEASGYKWVNRREGGLSAANCAGAILLPLMVGSEPNYRDECAEKIVPGIMDWFRNTLDF